MDRYKGRNPQRFIHTTVGNNYNNPNKPLNLEKKSNIHMAISTNSIIHYTDTIEAIYGILIEGFKIKYCAEILFLNEGSSQAAHPMISFCDIPLSQSQKHFKAYGYYGIGMTKEWAVKNGVNPVLYIDKKSLFAKSVYQLLKERRNRKSNLSDIQKRQILQIKSYAKNYSGPLKRKEVNEKEYKFYDEREWRLIPDSDTLNKAKFSITLSNYNKSKEKYNIQLKDVRIKFSSKDVSYIILKTTAEIPDMIEFLRKKYSDNCTTRELDVLFSKICSTEQIIDDY